jgi:soluble lytic murein transglycosylase-like protein
MGGARLLRNLLNHFKGDVSLTLAGYNAGPGAVARFGGRIPPFRETRNYVKRVNSLLAGNRRAGD